MKEPQTEADKVRKLRDGILARPGMFLGMKKPPIESLWGYTTGLTHAIETLEGRDNSSLAKFYLEKRYGALSEYRVMLDKHNTFQERLEYLKGFYKQYEEWLKAQE